VSVKIRLKRIGRKKQPTYRVVVIESRSARGGKEIEIVGHYSPYKLDKPLEINLPKISEWQGKGAIPSLAVLKLMRRAESGEGAGSIPAKEKPAKKAPPPVETAPPAEVPKPEPEPEPAAEHEESENTEEASGDDNPEPEA
jgi:small subunit ribosomal protein S16